jgi:tetratricopeptide (TPR) repeat protein
MRLDPQNEDSYASSEAVAYAIMRQYDRAIPALKRYLASYTNEIPARLILLACYVELGRNQEAHAEAQKLCGLTRNFLWHCKSKGSL